MIKINKIINDTLSLLKKYFYTLVKNFFQNKSLKVFYVNLRVLIFKL